MSHRKNTPERKLEMGLRRQKQLTRMPDRDARLVYYSKNSLPEYNK